MKWVFMRIEGLWICMKSLMLVTLYSRNQSSQSSICTPCYISGSGHALHIHIDVSAPMAHELKHSTEAISWSGVQGPT